MFSRYDADRVVRRWIRRVAVTVLIVMVTGIVAVAGFSAWVVSATVPVLVVDEQERPVSGAVVFDWSAAAHQPARSSPIFMGPLAGGGFGGIGAGQMCVPVMPPDGAEAASPTTPSQAKPVGSAGGAFGCGCMGSIGSVATRTSETPPETAKTKVLRWLHRLVQPFGVALVWDPERPVYTGGAGEVRVPQSKRLTVMSPGDLKYEPGQVYSVEQVAEGAKGLGPPARFVLRSLKPSPAALEKRVYWSCLDTPLSDFVKLVEQEIGRPVQLDKPAIQEEGIRLDTPIRIQVRDLPLRSALKLALGQYNLTFVWENQSIRITSILQAYNELETRLYPVRDLLPGEGDELLQYADELQEVIEYTVSPNCWSSVGGSSECAVFERERSLIVRHTPRGHELVEERLTTLRTAKNPLLSVDEDRIQQALARPVSFDIRQMSLEAACEFLSALGGVPNIIFDQPALEEEGITPQTSVTFRVHDLPLGLALHEMLRPLNLTTLVMNDVVLITSRLCCDCELVHRVYCVADLLDAGSPDPLSEIIESIVSPNSWCSVGGAGSTIYFTPRTLLVVGQCAAVHDEIGTLLAALRGGGSVVETEDDRRVREALAKPVTADFRLRPLEEVVRSLAAKVEIKNVFIDHAELEDVAVRPRTLVNLIVRDMPLRSALRSLLRLYGLAAVVEDGSLKVTSKLVAEYYNRVVGIYAVGDLLANSPDADWLIELIEQAVLPNSWSSVGGSGTIEFFAPRDYLVILATDEVHDDIAALLARLRGKPLPGSVHEDAIRQAIHLFSDWRLERVPLSTVASRLAEALACTVTIANPKDLSPETIVSVRGEGEPLDLALARGLEAIGARYVVRDESILISSCDDEPTTLVARTYAAGALVLFDDEADDLLAKLEESVDSESWSREGGSGTVSYVSTIRHLVVYHDEQHHLLVKQFLANLAAGRDNHIR